MNNVSSYALNGIIEPVVINEFEKHYISIRKKESRVYTNDEVVLLPDISQRHIHYKEWLVRKRSAERLVRYLKEKNKPLKIAEVGCGNGWLSAKLADIDNTRVTGIDINLTELKQAGEVFNKPNLRFVYGDIHDRSIPGDFDIVVFAASIQYFPSLKDIVSSTFSLLKDEGEIHILDSPFYKEKEAGNAIERTKKYYASAGIPEMAGYYFHHTLTDLAILKYSILSRGNGLMNKILRTTDPFPWIRITKM